MPADQVGPKQRSMICSVCSDVAHGMHFGARTCRACAVFFRRYALSKRQLQCTNNDGNCVLDGRTMRRNMCTLCRYNKCLRVGMSEENIQLNRDLNKLSIRRSPSSLDSENSNSPRAVSRQSSETCPEFMDRLKDIFAFFKPTEVAALSPEMSALDRMRMGLQRHRNHRPTLTDEVKCRPWMEDSLRAAEWFMFCEAFEALTMETKISIFKRKWRLWRKLERIQASLKALGKDTVVGERKILCPEGNIVHFSIAFNELCRENSGEIDEFWLPWVDRLLDLVSRFQEIYKPTDVEWTYVFSMLAFHCDDISSHEEANNALMCFRDQCCNDLHEHYISHGIHNYTDRMGAVCEFISVIEKIQYDFHTIVELATIFGKVDSSFCSEWYEYETK